MKHYPIVLREDQIDIIMQLLKEHAKKDKGTPREGMFTDRLVRSAIDSIAAFFEGSKEAKMMASSECI